MAASPSNLRALTTALAVFFILSMHFRLLVPSLLAGSSAAAYTECADDIDNDGDGDIDYPEDNDCSSLRDTTEDEFDEDELRLTLSDSQTTVEPRERLTYRITLQNDSRRQREFDVRFTVPFETLVTSMSDGGFVSGDEVRWNDIVIPRSSSRQLRVEVEVRSSVDDGDVLRAEVEADGERATDTTRVVDDRNDDNNERDVSSRLRFSVSDNRSVAERGDTLTYRIRLENRLSERQTGIDVSAELPADITFRSATEDGHRSGSRIIWDNLSLSSRDVRTLTLTVRVDSDASLNRDLLLRVNADGLRAEDRTRIERDANNDDDFDRGDVLLQKTADRSEVQPGDIVLYTIQVRNNTGRRIRNVDVTDRYDDRYARVISGFGDVSVSRDRLRWRIDNLDDGERWERSYELQITHDAPHGLSLNNTVTIDSPDVTDRSQTERVRTTRTGVIRELPRSGAANDVLFGSFVAALSAVQALWMRRRGSER